MASKDTSDQATKLVGREKASANFDLTSDVLASKLHDQIVGKTVLITGVSPTGLGAHAAAVIAEHSPKLLILASRRLSAITPVIDSIVASVSQPPRIVPLELDLASQSSVRKAAAELLKLTPVVDVLINNAGVMMLQDYATTPEGVEMHLAINHVGHFLFTNLIMSALLGSPQPRVINITSAAYFGSPIRFDDLNLRYGKDYEPFVAYAQSKTANLLFSLGLVRKLGAKGLLSFGVDPGGVAGTGINRAIPMSDQIKRGWRLEDGSPNPAIPWKTPAQSVASYIMAAFDPDIKDHNGETIAAGIFDEGVAPHAKDPEDADKLWTVSEKLVGQEFAY
ncbi:NAD(P)-binding protein [Coniochaeta ligniaria NRRL 30616]|uniref:NAD(P)-binding protein n=1 Tax=Coniochaeta ligniaria NRRL 30616 TaxID=1408157 RepID=A0A1J7JZI6_9PEZI|nr:NAD(P)-binding protein [Coniochaeta ligniaria NRRL 30616]